MVKVKVAVNGFGTIGKRVADAVSLQDDMEIIGIVKTKPSFEAMIAHLKDYDIYTPVQEQAEAFEKSGIKVEGTLEDLIDKVDIVVDCTPEGTGAEYRKVYEKHGLKAILQGGEEHEVAGLSFNSEANYEEALGKDYARVVSCNTTGLVRVLYALDAEFGIKKARVTLMRRGADPNDIRTGPINAIVPDPITLPSHHGHDVNTILPNLNIVTVAVKLSTTLMHFHALNIELDSEASAQDIVMLFEKRPRLRLVSGRERIRSTAEAMEYARDLGRPRGDMWENIIWRDSIIIHQGELYFFQAIHQEADVVPENVDCIRALLELEEDGIKSIIKTNQALKIK